MKRIILLLLFVSTLCADDWDYEEPCRQIGCVQFTYVKLGGAILPGNQTSIGPAFSIGRRYEEEYHAVDVSLNIGSGIGGITWATPKMMYLSYQSPFETKSAYWGAGLSWGGLFHYKPKKRFIGLLFELAFGYDLTRHCELRTFLEFNISQPLLPTDTKHKDYSPPALSLSYGIGF